PAAAPAAAPTGGDREKERREADEHLEKAQRELADLDVKVREAMGAMRGMKNDHEREEAKHRLEDQQKQQLEAKGRFDEAKKAVDQLEHHDDHDRRDRH